MVKCSDYIKEHYKKKLEELRKTELEKQQEIQKKKAEEEILEEVKTLMEKKETKKPGFIEKQAEELVKESQKVGIINKKTVIIPSLIVVLAILIGIYFFASPPVKAKFQPLDISPSNLSGLSMPVFYKNKFLFSFSGWESILEFSNKTDRLFGNEQYKKLVFDGKGKAYSLISLDDKIQLEPLVTSPDKITKIGWFYKPEQVKILDLKKRNEKRVNVKLEKGKILEKSDFEYTYYKNKPYFRLQFSPNSNSAGDFAYGFIMQGYNVALPNGTIIKNDNQIISLNKTAEIVLVENGNATKNISSELVSSISTETDVSRQAIQRKGSNFEASTDYEIFYSEKEKKAIVFYSPFALYFKNSFYWNVYRIYVPYNEAAEKHYPIYVFVFDSPILEYKDNDWLIISEHYTGSLRYYIDDIYTKLEAGA